MLSKNFLYYGTDQPFPERIPLRAGPLTVIFENGGLRQISFGTHEILRRIYVAVRDRSWGTVSPQISNLQIIEGAYEFKVSFDVICKQKEIDFHWSGGITGEQDGTINFFMRGKAHSTFLANRIGFCVLHPIVECAGRPCEIEHTNGSKAIGKFPEKIAPHQPFKDIRVITHEISPDIKAEVRLSGEIFEMEDQRNWSDASFKIYSTPLELPCPVLVQNGKEFNQYVRLKLLGNIKKQNFFNVFDRLVNINLYPETKFPIPQIGLSISPFGDPRRLQDTNRLRALHLHHLRHEIWMGEDDWESNLRFGISDAHLLQVPLEMALYVTDSAESELQALLHCVNDAEPDVCRWIIFHEKEPATSLRWVALARKILKNFDATVPYGCGSDANFAELNRGYNKKYQVSKPSLLPDFFCYAANPQVHANDNQTINENLFGLGETVRCARELFIDKPIVLSPLSFKPRGRSIIQNASEGIDLLPTVDPRLKSLFGAGWILGSFKYLAENQISSITYFESPGQSGEGERKNIFPNSFEFSSTKGVVYPFYHVLADIKDFLGGRVVLSKSTNPLSIESLVLQKGNKTRIMIANLVDKIIRIRISDLPQEIQVKTLDETNVIGAMYQPKKYRHQHGIMIRLQNSCFNSKVKPHSILRVDFSRK